MALASLGPCGVHAEQAQVIVSTDAQAVAGVQTLRDAKQYADALRLIEERLAADPTSRTFLRLQVLTLEDMGASQRAWELVRQRPELFAEYERERLSDDRIAGRIRWGEMVSEREADRYAESAEALGMLRDVQDNDPPKATWQATRLRVDALSALNHMKRHREVFEGYDALLRDHVDVPAYIWPTVADSMLALRRPEDAAELLQRYLRLHPNEVNPQIELAYAWMESERFDLALPMLERLASSQNPWPRRIGAVRGYENWDRFSADMTLAAARSFANDNVSAERMLKALASLGPMNASLQAALGSVEARRQRPSQALERYAMALQLDPRGSDALFGRVDALTDLGRTDQARAATDDLVARYPEDPRTPRAVHDLAMYRGWQFRVEANSGRSHGGRDGTSTSPLGSRDGAVDLEARSPLIDDRWRVTAQARDDRAKFAGETVRFRGAGIGLDYRYDRLGVSLAALQASDRYDHGATSVLLDADWRFNDAWTGEAALARKDPEASLQARRYGITADSIALGAKYTPSETTELDTRWTHFRYSDGNRRDELALDSRQRMFSAAHVMVDGLLSASAGRGSDGAAAPYFNPSRDASISAGIRIDHLGWRRYESQFRELLDVTVGPSWQRGYGTAWVPAVTYRHRWQPDTGNAIEYGVSWSRPVYDGRRENRVAFQFSWQWGTAP